MKKRLKILKIKYCLKTTAAIEEKTATQHIKFQ